MRTACEVAVWRSEGTEALCSEQRWLSCGSDGCCALFAGWFSWRIVVFWMQHAWCAC